MFGQKLIDMIAYQHKALAVIIWVGSDAMWMRSKQNFDYTPILRAPHVRHIAIGKWVADDLSACGIPHVYLPIVPVLQEKWKCVPLGDKVYYYGNDKRPELYGQGILDKVQKAMPDIEFITANSCNDYAPDQMPGLYKQCFMGLRPTIHDGQPTSMAELALMGRRCIHNGHAPYAINWKNTADIVRIIREEQAYIGSNGHEVRGEALGFLNIGGAWLDTKFYGVTRESSTLSEIR